MQTKGIHSLGLSNEWGFFGLNRHVPDVPHFSKSPSGYLFLCQERTCLSMLATTWSTCPMAAGMHGHTSTLRNPEVIVYVLIVNTDDKCTPHWGRLILRKEPKYPTVEDHPERRVQLLDIMMVLGGFWPLFSFRDKYTNSPRRCKIAYNFTLVAPKLCTYVCFPLLSCMFAELVGHWIGMVNLHEFALIHYYCHIDEIRC